MPDATIRPTDGERLLSAPALEQAAAIAAGEVSSRELMELTLARIEERDGEINALVLVDSERALEEAGAADDALRRGGPASPLHGVPTAIKDIIPTKGMRTTFGSRAFADTIPDADSGSVARVRAAGMVILGKTNTPEFATLSLTDSELFGPCRNPWDTSRNAGGSSGGTAAVVAAEMLALAPGTDAGGSVRVPAAWCGIWGLKTSRGRVSMGPRAGERIGGLATEGPMGKTVTDIAALLDVESGYAWGDPYWAPPPERPFRELVDTTPGRLRVRVVTDAPDGGTVDPAYLDAVARVAGLLADAGHDVEAGPFAWAGDAVEPSAAVMWATINGYYGDPDDALLTPFNVHLARHGRTLTAFEYIEHKMEIERAARRIVRQWADFDVLLTPASPMLAPPNDYLSDVEADEQLARVLRTLSFARQFNFTGQPGLAVPTGLSPSGLPVGIQLVGPPAGEALLLQLGRQLEEALPWQPAWPRDTQGT